MWHMFLQHKSMRYNIQTRFVTRDSLYSINISTKYLDNTLSLTYLMIIGEEIVTNEQTDLEYGTSHENIEFTTDFLRNRTNFIDVTQKI
jgi:hypothetical protein